MPQRVLTMSKGSSAPTALCDETDEDLLCWMSMRNEEPGQAQEAWAEFYRRHVKYLYGACTVRLKNYGLQADDINDLVQNTFLKAFDKAGTFRPVPEKRSSESDQAWARAWLGAIAQRLLLDSFRRTPKLELVENTELDNFEAPAVETECSPTSPRFQSLLNALDRLTEREREIMLVSYAWYEPGKQLTIPDEDLKRLASDYQTTTVNLRQIRARAKQKIQDYIDKHERQP